LRHGQRARRKNQRHGAAKDSGDGMHDESGGCLDLSRIISNANSSFVW
jgi:hypothetical protein